MDANKLPESHSTTTATVALQPASRVLDHGQSDEDLMRADVYGLLAELFASPPSDGFFNRMAASPKPSADDPKTPLTEAWSSVLARAESRAPAVIREEFKSLFVAVGKPDVAANASFYLHGSLNGQALVDIRSSLDGFGLERDPASPETEDHISAVCEVMRFLVAGELEGSGPPQDLLAAQRDFFHQHLASWAFDFLDAVEAHHTAHFYAAVAVFARAFFEIERQAFDIYAADHADPA